MTTPELLAEIIAALRDRAREAHQMHQMFSKGALHPGAFETCDAISCEHVRQLLERHDTADAEFEAWWREHEATSD